MSARVLAASAPGAIEEAAAIIRAGGLVAFPTETVYGLGADALDPAAVARIFAAKGRPADDPLIVHLASAAALPAVSIAAPPLVATLAARFWPGPLTLVLPRAAVVPLSVTAGRDTVAVRVPSHPVALALIERAARPIAAPSANLFARPSPTTTAHVVADLADGVDLILDGGPTAVGLESTVLDLTTKPPRILRPGGVTAEQLRPHLPDLVDSPILGQDASSPGTAERHYSPRARVDLFDRADGSTLAVHARQLASRGEHVGILVWDDDLRQLESLPNLESIGPIATPAQAANRLYAALRALDSNGVDAIVARLPPPAGLGAALRDRLRRAASGRLLG